ncbi:MAG: hypothetical protein ABJ360_22535 [Roseobacter sp.]
MSLDRAVEMARDFHAYNKPLWPFVEADMRETLGALPFLKVSERGFIAATICNLPISKRWVIASEFLWWGDPYLIRDFRAWAKARGANEIRYSCPAGSRVEGFYQTIARPSEAVYSEFV